jgi:beta-galactosidase
MKDDANALWPQRQPGPLAALLGAAVEQYYALDEPVGVKGDLGTGKAAIWAEEVRPDAADVQVLATYSDPGGWLDGKAAVVTRKAGRGSITYFGAWLDPVTMKALAARLLGQAKIAPLVPDAHPDLEISERAGGGKRVMIVINHGADARPLMPPKGARFVSGDWAKGEMGAHGVALFRLP